MTRRATLPGTLLLALAMLAATPSDAQEYSGPRSHTNPLISTTAYPPSRSLRSLNARWTRFTISGDQSNADATNIGIRVALQLERLGVGVYYTQGESVTMGDQTYLVAYRIDNEMDQQELQQAFQEMFGGDQVLAGPVKFLPDTKLSLSLLNLRTMGSMQDLTRFDPAREIMGPGDITAASTDNLRRLGQVLQRFGRFQNLPFSDVQAMQAGLQNQAHRRFPRTLMHPTTRQPYQPNTRLSGKRLGQITNRARVVAIFEASPGTDNKRGAVFLDGHVERIPESNWLRVFEVGPQGLSPQQIHAEVGRRLQHLNRVLLRTAHDNSGVCPTISDTAGTYRLLRARGGYDRQLYQHPVTQQTYRVNTALSNKALSQITNRARVVSFHEATPGTDGKIGAVYIDGHIERVARTKWKQVLERPLKTTTASRATAPGAR